MDTVKINWSGGKDSTASVILHLERGDFCKIVYYIPMLTEDIPLVTAKHYGFIRNARMLFENAGAICYQAHGITYWEHTHRIITRGPRKGEIMGFGLGYGFCLFRDYSKRRALDGVDVGYFDYADIGIAADETKRLAQLGSKRRSILAESGVTEGQAYNICLEHKLLSPVYGLGMRDGCAICPNGSRERLKQWAWDYPHGVEVLRQIEKDCAVASKGKIYRDGTKWSDYI